MPQWVRVSDKCIQYEDELFINMKPSTIRVLLSVPARYFSTGDQQRFYSPAVLNRKSLISKPMVAELETALSERSKHEQPPDLTNHPTIRFRRIRVIFCSDSSVLSVVFNIDFAHEALMFSIQARSINLMAIF